jgi:probable phosphoglycerate mutase
LGVSQVEKLWIVRHGESVGNLAWQAAEDAGSHFIDVSPRDADVPRSRRGEREARALGLWLRRSSGGLPTVIITSPYVRTHRTAKLLVAAAGLEAIPLLVDERLREKEFGVLNRMTKAGIAARMPDQAELRQIVGKFYYRPPGGESWCDIVLRLRNLWTSLRMDHANERVLLVCHSVVTFCLRYIIEQLTEQQILDIDIACDVGNCAITSYSRKAGTAALALDEFNFVAPLEDAGEQLTLEADAPLPK